MSVTDLGTYDVNNITYTSNGVNFAAITVTANGVMTYSSTAPGTTVQLKQITDPVDPQDAVTKYYVDNLVASGISWKQAVNVATTPADSANPLSFYQAGAVVDATTLVSGWRLLIKNPTVGISPTSAANNGIYIVTVGAAPYRSIDATTNIQATGAATFVEGGTTNGSTAWVCNTTTGADFNPLNFGFPIDFVLLSSSTPAAGVDGQVQFNANGVFGASSGLTFTTSSGLLTATQISTTSLSVTGPSSFTGTMTANNATFNGPVTINNTLSVTSLATFGPISATSGTFSDQVMTNTISAISQASTVSLYNNLTTGGVNFATGSSGIVNIGGGFINLDPTTGGVTIGGNTSWVTSGSYYGTTFNVSAQTVVGAPNLDYAMSNFSVSYISSTTVTAPESGSTVYIAGATIGAVTNYALNVASGLSNFGGAVNMNSTLNVTSLATFNSISATSITATFISVTSLSITAPVNFTNLSVTSLTVSGPSVFNGTVTANTTATFNGPLVANNTVTINNTLSVTSLATFGPISATSATFSGPVVINNTLNVTSLATFGPISATSASFSGPLSATTLTVSGPSTLSGPVVINNTLNVTSLATFGPISATSASFSGPLAATTLTVSGPATFNGPVSFTSAFTGGAAGLNTQIQFNNNGSFGAYSGLTVTTATNAVAIGVTTSGSLTIGPNFTMSGSSTTNSIDATGTGAFSMTNTAAQAVNLFNTTTSGALSMGSALTGTMTLGNSTNGSTLNTTIYGTTVAIGTAASIVYVKGTAAASSTSTGALVVSGGAGFANDCYSTRWRTVSDVQYKTNINRLSGSLDLLNKLEGYTYNWKEGFSGYSEGKAYGVIAQQLESAGLGDLIVTDASNSKTVDYNGLIPILIEAVKELTTTVNTLKSERSEYVSEYVSEPRTVKKTFKKVV